jgi:hypothetical protein
MLYTILFLLYLLQLLTCALMIPSEPRSGGFQKFPPNNPYHKSSPEVDVKDFFFSNINKKTSGSISNNIQNKITDRKPIIDDCGTRTVNFYAQRTPKIVGGTETPYGAYPWQVEIQVFSFDNESFIHHCGGAVIGNYILQVFGHTFFFNLLFFKGDKLVLTAAHCLQVNQIKSRILLIFNKKNFITDTTYRIFTFSHR